MTTRSALITGLSSTGLTADEAAFLKSARPCGIILFTRNCAAHDQIRRLVGDAKSAIGSHELLVLIDQEGGRVQRLRPPLGRALPPAAAYAKAYAIDASEACATARAAARLLAADLTALAINTNCAPVLDVPVDGADQIIGDRAYGRDVAAIVALGRAVAEGFMAGGVLPVIKHIPGHGRAMADSHLALPVVTTAADVLRRTDFATFAALADLPAAMTAHVVFAAIDPDRPASTSARVIGDVIRRDIGFDGLLMSDDLGMRALSGPMRERAAAVIAAGSDVALHCSGDIGEMRQAAEAVPPLAGRPLARFATCTRVLQGAQGFDIAEAEAALLRALAYAHA